METSKIRISFFVSCLLLLISSVSSAQKPYDYVIKNASVFDGESFTPRREDVAISGDRIVQAGNIPSSDGEKIIEAGGLFLSPGFIDIHTHSDFNPFVYPDLGNKILQGVTT